MFFPEVHKGDKYAPSASRENAINRRLNSINGFSEVPITKQSSSSSATTALELDVSSTIIDDVEYWSVTTAWFVVQRRTGDWSQRISNLLIHKYTETSDGIYAHLTLFPRTGTGSGYSCCYRLASYYTTGAVSDIAGSSYRLCKSSDTIMLTKPIAFLAVINTSTGEVVYSYPYTRFFDLYYHGSFSISTTLSSDGYARRIEVGYVFFGSQRATASTTSFAMDNYNSIGSIYLISTWDGEDLSCSFDTTYKDSANLLYDVTTIYPSYEYPNGINLTGRIMP